MREVSSSNIDSGELWSLPSRWLTGSAADVLIGLKEVSLSSWLSLREEETTVLNDCSLLCPVASGEALTGLLCSS